MFAQGTWALKGATVVIVFASSMPAQAVPGDMNGDGYVDLKDYALFHECLKGPGEPVSSPDCQQAMLDGDSDVDLLDVARFQLAFTGACPGSIPNDSCLCPITSGDGGRLYSNVGATTDGPDEPSACDFSGRSNVESDIWYCYTASCTGTALISLCGSNFDTKLAVYDGCDCPTAKPRACSDDDCGRAFEIVQSRVTVSVIEGQQYLLRVGAFRHPGETFDAQGEGRLTIGCNVADACAGGSADCFTPSPTNAPGCGDPECCTDTCALDQSCCDVEWNATCAGEAQGICTGSFAACAPKSGPCDVPDATPGCDDVNCCNTICFNDPFCCLQAWDTDCADEAALRCFPTCTASAEDCFMPHESPGCNVESCCEIVCKNEPYCCDTVWDEVCADYAIKVCE